MATRTSGYSALQIALHWLTAFLVFGAYFASEGMGDALQARIDSGATGTQGNTLHVWLGGAVLLVVILRIVVRWRQGAPAPSDKTPAGWAKAAVWGHRALYALLVAVPVGGALTWYGGFASLGKVHETAGKALMILAVGHVFMAMLHEGLLGDGTLARMIRPKA